MGQIKGTKEWAQSNVNIARGCSHDCRYCYAKHMMTRWLKKMTPQQWRQMEVDQSKVDKNYSKRRGRVMFPSAHDITPAILSEYLCVLRKLLDAGNDVLIVTKPHLECIELICRFYKEYRSQITFRFTIGSMDDHVLRFWEPGAPVFAERFAALQLAYAEGFATSVSCEPYLDPYPIYLYEKLRPYITESFWIGKLNKFASRVDLSDVPHHKRTRYVEPLLAAMTDSAVRTIIRLLEDRPMVRFKNSIEEVRKKRGIKYDKN